MRRHFLTVALAICVSLASSCTREVPKEVSHKLEEPRKYKLERVGPANAVQLYADGFEQLKPTERIFVYYLSLAALAGRDIAIDQHHRKALEVRQLFEQIHQHSAGIDPAIVQKLDAYLKLFWINNGFYDDLTSRKFVPDCAFEDFKKACSVALQNGAHFDLTRGETLESKLENLRTIIFDPDYEPVMTDKTPGKDFISASAVNFYARGLTFGEVEAWAKTGGEKNPLNSFVTKKDGKIEEQVWRAGGTATPSGLYSADLKAVIKYLQMAIPYASSDYQAETIRKLIRFFETGNLEDFRQYNIHWVKDSSNVDFIMGFIEVYLDPRGQKAEWEASIFYTDPEQTKLMQNLARFAQYFEDKAPWNDAFKKKIEHSSIANVINVVTETGGTGPVSPVGINLPNEQAIRQQYGSKSVLLHNIVDAYEKSQGKVLVKEFAWDAEEIEMEDQYGSKADNLHTAMHEVIGHGSGKVSDKLKGKDPSNFLPGYYNTLEEARADLVALWNAWDDKLVDIGLAKDKDEARKIGETMLRQAVRVTLTQLRRIGKSDQLSEDHMKDRALIGHYLMEHSNGVKVEIREGKTYYRIVDFEATRKSAGELLAEIMRIKAEGDLNAAKALIDKYGLKVDPKLRDEVQERVKKLDIPSYTGFVMPKLEPVRDPQGKVTDIRVSYPLDLAKKMIEYSHFTKKEKEATSSN
jgi:dipeptidyl-peptidase-3